MSSEPPEIQLSIGVSRVILRLLAVLDDEDGSRSADDDSTKAIRVINRLIDHAQQGVYRPGAWERDWIKRVFWEDWEQRLERDPQTPMFDRPKEAEEESVI